MRGLAGQFASFAKREATLRAGRKRDNVRAGFERSWALWWWQVKLRFTIGLEAVFTPFFACALRVELSNALP